MKRSCFADPVVNGAHIFPIVFGKIRFKYPHSRTEFAMAQPSQFAYVATAQKSTGVSHSLVASFTGYVLRFLVSPLRCLAAC
jgi:hypothetical protein